MFARNSTSGLRWRSFSCGLKSAKTFSCVSRVFATFRSKPYSPLQKKVFWPLTRCSPSRLMLRPLKTAVSSSPKSSPTTATTSTSLKNDAATEKYVAEPPMQRSTFPNGVLMASNATLPTTRIIVAPESLHVFGDERREIRFRLELDRRRVGHDCVLQRIDAFAVALPRRRARNRNAQRPLRHLRVRTEIADDLLDADLFRRLVPAVVVGDERHRRVTNLRLARELRFLQVRHADHVDVPCAIQLRLRARRELRAFHAEIRSALVHDRARFTRRRAHQKRNARANRI